MRHQDLTINHRLESWVYPNAAGRTGATGFVSGDIGRIAYQTDTGQYWRLTAVTPAWQLIAPPTPVPPVAYASKQTPAASPANTTNSATGVMMGLGVGQTFTPTATGKVLVMFDGTLSNTVASKQAQAQIRYGIGTPPTNGAAPVGTAAGGIAVSYGDIPLESAPLGLKALITGLPIGVAHWFDLLLVTTSGGAALVLSTTTSVVELP